MMAPNRGIHIMTSYRRKLDEDRFRLALPRLFAFTALSLIASVIATSARAETVRVGIVGASSDAPFFIADAKGYFKEEGIDHKIVDGGPGKNPIPIVAVGQAQFGIATNGMYLVSARLTKDPVDVVAIATLFQQAPTSYIRIADPGAPAPRPKDLEGKTVGVQAGTEFMFRAFAKKNGVDDSKVKLVTAQATAEPLMAGKMDYFLGWIVNQTYQVEQESAKADAPATVGVDLVNGKPHAEGDDAALRSAT